jgi:DNA-binding transcriptional LysR family regulator
VNLAQLRTFVAVVEHGSFSAAARALGLSQPAVTMQVQSLEAETGATLLDRRYRRVELTDTGRALLPHAEHVLADLEQARLDMERLSEHVTGRLNIAASTTPGDYVIPGLLGSFLAENPEVGITLRVYDTAEVIGLVADGEAHLGMVGAEVEGGRVVFEEMGFDELVMVCPPASSLATRAKLVTSDLVEETFIMREPGSGTRMVTEDAFRAGGVDPADLRVLAEFGTSEAILRAVEGGMGLGVVSRWVAAKALELGTARELAAGGSFPIERHFFAVTARGALTRAAEAFLQHMRERLLPV